MILIAPAVKNKDIVVALREVAAAKVIAGKPEEAQLLEEQTETTTEPVAEQEVDQAETEDSAEQESTPEEK